MTIVRDKAYGVPHIYGDTRADTMFGAGYAGAADRLFLMDVLRHTGRAELASFLGGSNADADAGQWQFAPYTEADLEKQLDAGAAALRRRGRAGGRRRRRTTSKASTPTSPPPALDPTTEAGRVRAARQADGTVEADRRDREASLIGGIFGKGGGNELNSALTMQAFVKRFGKKAGRKAWTDFRAQERPRGADHGLQALPLRDPQRLRQDAAWRCRTPAQRPFDTHDRHAPRAAPAADRHASRTRSAAPARSARAAKRAGHASNWELVSAKHSAPATRSR